MTIDNATPLWQPSRQRIETGNLAAFAADFAKRLGRPEPFSSYRDLHAASVAQPEAFWSLVWDYGGVIGDKGARVIEGDAMPGARFFPDGTINFAENLLRRRDDGDAIVFRSEDKIERRMSHAQLAALVARIQQALKAAGIGVGDRVAAMLPNMPESVAIMLATSSLGAIFSSCSPDFGERGVLDRFGQIEPKVFFACDGYWYAGKRLNIAEKLKPIVEGLPTARHAVIVNMLGDANAVVESLPRAQTLDTFIADHPARTPEFVRLPLDHPAYILFSSGTTGVPKCIVHGQGILLKHLTEHRLHSDIRPGDRVFYFTTMGWMMWNWLVSALASEATLMLYDGSPFHPQASVLFDYAQA
ncbi:MAG: AMP-binding protein, partial [Beijerinckiaceae bacterium]